MKDNEFLLSKDIINMFFQCWAGDYPSNKEKKDLLFRYFTEAINGGSFGIYKNTLGIKEEIYKIVKTEGDVIYAVNINQQTKKFKAYINKKKGDVFLSSFEELDQVKECIAKKAPLPHFNYCWYWCFIK